MSTTRRVARHVLPVPAKGALKLTTRDVENDDTFWMFTHGELDSSAPRAWLVAAITHGFQMDVSDHFREDGTLVETDAFRFGWVNRVYAKIGGGFRVYRGTTRAGGVDFRWLAFIRQKPLVKESLVFSNLHMTEYDWLRVLEDIVDAAKADGLSEKAVRRHLNKARAPSK